MNPMIWSVRVRVAVDADVRVLARTQDEAELTAETAAVKPEDLEHLECGRKPEMVYRDATELAVANPTKADMGDAIIGIPGVKKGGAK